MKKGASKVSGSEIKKLKDEIKSLRQAEKPESVHEEILEIRDEISKLMHVFETAVSFMKEEAPSQEPIVSKLNQLLDENSILAKGIMKATRQLDSLQNELKNLEGMMARLTERRMPVQKAKQASSPRPPPPPSPQRSAVFEKYKQEFSR
jgi:dynactin complex subunit